MEYTLYNYVIKIFQDDRDSDFGAYIEEIPNVSAFGKTPELAMKELENVFTEWIEVCKEYGDPIPEPYKSRKYGGKVLVRMPISLHRQLFEEAEREKVSLNQEILYCISTGFEHKRCRRTG